MYQIFFYKDKNGKEPVLEYLRELSSKKDKNSRIKANKINDYIETLKQYGTRAGEPYIKHLDGDIWELRPIRDRILFCRMGRTKFYTTALFYEADTENTVQRNRTS